MLALYLVTAAFNYNFGLSLSIATGYTQIAVREMQLLNSAL